MRTLKFLCAAVIFLSFISNSYSQTSYSFNEGLKAANSSGKVIFLEIYSGSDSWSKKMDSDVFPSAGVKTALSNFVFIKLDGDGAQKYNYEKKDYTSKELSRRFGGTGYPTFVFLNSDGSVISFKYNGDQVSSLSGFLGAEDFTQMLNFFQQGTYKTADLSTVILK